MKLVVSYVQQALEVREANSSLASRAFAVPGMKCTI